MTEPEHAVMRRPCASCGRCQCVACLGEHKGACLIMRDNGYNVSGTTTGNTPNDPFMATWQRLLDKIIAIRKAKRNDYTGDSGDNLYNYRRAAEVAGCSVELLMLARMQEKVTRVSVLLRGTEQQVLDETIEDTLVDIGNIAMLIGASLENPYGDS